MTSTRLLVALAAALLAVASPPRHAAACSVCLAGDPLYSTLGASAQQRGDVTAFVQLQGWRKQSGLLPHEGGGGPHAAAGTERNRSQRLDLFVSFTPLDRLTLTLDLPFAFNEIRETEDGASETSRLDGVGDLALSASVVLWRNREVLPATWVEGRALLKTPTGRTGRSRNGIVDPHLQAGTGSWDFGFGLAATHRLEWGSLYTSAFYRENGAGDFADLDYAYGDVVLWNGALEVPVGHALGWRALDWLTAGAELNYRFAGFDRVEGERFDDSGGSILYATPSLRFRLPIAIRERPLSLRVAVQLPFTSSWLNGDQDEREVWSVGLLAAF